MAKDILRSVGRELKENPPAVLAKTRKKKGKAAAERQRKAILLIKARERGASVPKRPSVRAEVKRAMKKHG